MSAYKFLLWDIDGTILDFLASEKAALKALFLRYGLGECTDEMIGRYSAINVRYWQMLEKGEMSKPDILVGRFREFFEREGIDASKAEAFNADYQQALGDTIVFRDECLPLLLEQRETHILAAITNGTRAAQKKKLARSGLDMVFDHIYISETVGFEKPNKGFFDHVIVDLGISDPRQALVIGDSLTSDITGAVNAGMASCWYNPDKKTNDMGVMPDYEITDLRELREIV